MTPITKEHVTAVVDGDTFRTGQSPDAVRLEGVDTPEPREPGYAEAKAALTRLILRREVRVDTKAYGAYGRRVAQVRRLPDYLDVNAEMQAYTSEFRPGRPGWQKPVAPATPPGLRYETSSSPQRGVQDVHQQT